LGSLKEQRPFCWRVPLHFVAIDQNPVPPDGTVGKILTADGIALRYAYWAASNSARPQGTVAIITGRAEFIEKYFETIADLRQRGFAIAIFDWRGQGLSQRLLPDRRRGHIGDFRLYHRDLEAFEQQVLAPFCPKPWYALAHSMGGTILLDKANESGVPFERQVLCAPMIALKSLPYPGGTRFITGLLSRLGFGGSAVPFRYARAATTRPFGKNVLTSDPERFARFLEVIASAPELAIGIPSFGWVHAALSLMHRVAKSDFGTGITTPSLIFAPTADQVVDARAAEHFTLRLKHGRCLPIEGCQHEILLERDCFRDQFWAAFDRFIAGPDAARIPWHPPLASKGPEPKDVAAPPSSALPQEF